VRLATLLGISAGAGIVADLEATERRKVTALTASVNQAEKLAALGTLAAGIAHEINNPIGVITSRVELMRLDADVHQLPEEVRDDLAVVHRQAGRVARITQGLLSFARKSPREWTSIDLNRIVDDTLVLLEHPLTRHGVSVVAARAHGLPRIAGDRNALQQVLVNLLTNARDAIAGAGTIEVRTETSPDRRQVRLSVRDTGRGIPPETLSRIFEPFFTTKAEGTGLGLAISYGIVRDHHGTIDVDSRPDHGTTFTVTLPAAARADERA
jgi:signal transduction histidine kinase